MAWACGAAFHFPLLDAALRTRDFLGAALECRIDERGNPGVVPRNAANRTLLRNAHYVERGGFDPSVLYWPTALTDDRPTLREIANPPSDPAPVVDWPIVHAFPSRGDGSDDGNS